MESRNPDTSMDVIVNKIPEQIRDPSSTLRRLLQDESFNPSRSAVDEVENLYLQGAKIIPRNVGPDDPEALDQTHLGIVVTPESDPGIMNAIAEYEPEVLERIATDSVKAVLTDWEDPLSSTDVKKGEDFIRTMVENYGADPTAALRSAAAVENQKGMDFMLSLGANSEDQEYKQTITDRQEAKTIEKENAFLDNNKNLYEKFIDKASPETVNQKLAALSKSSGLEWKHNPGRFVYTELENMDRLTDLTSAMQNGGADAVISGTELVEGKYVLAIPQRNFEEHTLQTITNIGHELRKELNVFDTAPSTPQQFRTYQIEEQ